MKTTLPSSTRNPHHTPPLRTEASHPAQDEQELSHRLMTYIDKGNYKKVENFITHQDGAFISRLLRQDVRTYRSKPYLLSEQRQESHPLPHYCLLKINQDDLDSFLVQKKIADLLIKKGAPRDSKDHRGKSYDEVCEDLFFKPLREHTLELIVDYINHNKEDSYQDLVGILEHERINNEEQELLDHLLTMTTPSIIALCVELGIKSKSLENAN